MDADSQSLIFVKGLEPITDRLCASICTIENDFQTFLIVSHEITVPIKVQHVNKEQRIFTSILRHTLPLGMSETFTYNASGTPLLKNSSLLELFSRDDEFVHSTFAVNRASRTNFKGELTEYEYDDHNRLEYVYHEGMLEQELTYTQDGLRKTVTDDRGTTTYEYDPDRRRLAKVIRNSPTMSLMDAPFAKWETTSTIDSISSLVILFDMGPLFWRIKIFATNMSPGWRINLLSAHKVGFLT